MENMYRVNVALAGDIRHVVMKEGVSVPELAILRSIHSDSAITNITLTAKEKYDSDSERERLGKIYGADKVAKLFNAYGDLPMEIKKLKINPSLMAVGEPIGTFPKGKKKTETETETEPETESV
jgi:hypothetical protein